MKNTHPSIWAGRVLLTAHLLLCPLLFCRQTAEAFEVPRVALLCLTVLLLGGLAVMHLTSAGGSLRERLRLPGDPVSVGLLFFLVSAIVSTFASLSPQLSLRGWQQSPEGLVTVFAYVGLFLATRAFCPTLADGRRLLLGVAVAAPVLAVYALAQVLKADPLPWANQAAFGTYIRPFATLGHPNFLGAYLGMAFPVLAWLTGRTWHQGQRRTAAVLAGAAVLVLAAVVACLSRGAWLACAASLGVLGAGRIAWTRRRLATVAALLLLVLAGVVLLGAVQPKGDGLLAVVARRARNLGEPAGRQYVWTAALRVFRDNPSLGCGLDVLPLAITHERTTELWESEWSLMPTKAHNGILQVLATQGLLGGLALAIFVGGLVMASVRAWRRAAADDRPLLLALFAGLVGFGVQGLFSFNVAACGTLFITYAALVSRWSASRRGVMEPAPEETEAHGLIGGSLLAALAFLGGWLSAGGEIAPAAWLGAGAVLATLAVMTYLVVRFAGDFALTWPVRSTEAAPGVRGWANRFAAWALVLVTAGGGLGRVVWASVQAQRAAELAGRDPGAAVALFKRAVALDPSNDLYWARLAQDAQAAAGQARTAEERREQLLEARTALERATALVPANAEHHGNLARVLADLAHLHLAHYAEAFAEFNRALEYDPVNVYLYVDAGAAAVETGNVAWARWYAQTGSALYPRFGPLLVQRATLALRDRRVLDASQFLWDAVIGEWHGDEAGKRTAEKVLYQLQPAVEAARKARPNG